MEKIFLILFSRKGCCLCEALEEKLKNISLIDINPSLELSILDIDTSDVCENDRIRYDLEVPVLFVRTTKNTKKFQLPRVSPRIDSQSLHNWLEKIIIKKFSTL